MLTHIEPLWVPCDARMNRRDAELAALRQTHPDVPGSSCASRRAWTGVKIKDERLRTKVKEELNIVIPACLKPESILFTVSGYRHSPV